MILAKKQCDQENVPGKENGILKVPGPSAAHKTTPVQVLLAVPTDRVCREISLPWYLHDSIGIYHGLCTMVFLQISTGHSSFLTCGHHYSTKQILYPKAALPETTITALPWATVLQTVSCRAPELCNVLKGNEREWFPPFCVMGCMRDPKAGLLESDILQNFQFFLQYFSPRPRYTSGQI